MEKNNDHIDELIGKYLAGEAAAEEVAFIESWTSENDNNRKYFEQVKTIFNKAPEVIDLQTYDTDAAWVKLKRSLRGAEAKTVALPPSTNNWPGLFWRIAAGLALVIGVGYFVFESSSSKKVGQPFVVVATKATVMDTLPDGSDVVLNKQSELAYSVDKKKKIHTVKLKGEAYFNIHHDETKTFIIDIGGVLIKDIGTSFNVKAYPESNTVEVVVESGEVMFYTDKDSGVLLRANGKGVYDKTTKSFTIDRPEANVLAYKTKFFAFSNSDLVTVIEALNDVYDKKIYLSDSIKGCHLTVSFNNETHDEIVAIIAETLGLTIKESEGKIMLEGPGCEQ